MIKQNADVVLLDFTQLLFYFEQSRIALVNLNNHQSYCLQEFTKEIAQVQKNVYL